MKIDPWPVDKPKPYPRNARKISDLAVEKVANSIQEFGWQQPIVVDLEGVIIAGHTRLLAAKKLGLKEVPVSVASGLSDEQVRAYRLMDNRSHEEAEWDLDLLGAELFDLSKNGINLQFLTGFDENELADLLTPKGLIGDEDSVPDPPANPVTMPGDLFLLGTHRLLCGDSTKVEDVARLLDGEKPLLMVTDPPYGVAYDPTWRDGKGGFSTAAVKQRGKVPNDDRAGWREAWALFPGDVAYVWHGGLHAPEVAADLVAVGFKMRAQIIWAKQQGVFSRGDYHWQHEPCWYAVKESGKGHWAGDRKQTTVWEIQSLNPTGNRKEERVGHGTQKPVECMRRPILNNSKPGAAVYDPFCGSGTTLIACESEGRRCYAMEIDPVYCDVIVARWEAATGKKAVLAAGGLTFEQLRSDRLGVEA